MIFLCSASLIVSFLALLGAIANDLRLRNLQKQVDELKNIDVKVLWKDMITSKLGEITVKMRRPTKGGKIPVGNPYTEAVLSGEIDPAKVSLLDFYTKSEIVGDRIKTREQYEKMLRSEDYESPPTFDGLP